MCRCTFGCACSNSPRTLAESYLGYAQQPGLSSTGCHPKAPGREPLGLYTAAAEGRDSAFKLEDRRVDFRAARAVAFLHGAASVAVATTT